MKNGDRLGQYILERELGRGLSASTWLARKESSGEPQEGGAASPSNCEVVLKILDLSETNSWNAVDIFRREAEALRVLRCPGIPSYYEYFESSDEGHLRLVISMEYIEGQNLESLVGSGKRFSEAEVERLLARLADILSYLGSLRPPIVHRDVNPRNILLSENGAVALVDFSGVQDAVRTTLHPGATLVGTAGYIPIEQVAGRASHRSDLYGAAATAVFLLTGRNPAELPTTGLKIDFAQTVDVSPRLARVLNSWLEPDVERRGLSAEKAAHILRGETEVDSREEPSAAGPERSGELSVGNFQSRGENDAEDAFENLRNAFGSIGPAGFFFDAAKRIQAAFSEKRSPPNAKYPDGLPSDSKVSAETSEDGVFIRIPGFGVRGRTALSFGFPIFWLGFVAFWTTMAVNMQAPFFFPMFSLPFWIVGIAMIRNIAKHAFGRAELVLNRDGLVYRTSRWRSEHWPISDIGAISVQRAKFQVNSSETKELRIETGTRSIGVGTGLSERELLYLEGALRRSLEKLKGSRPKDDSY